MMIVLTTREPTETTTALDSILSLQSLTVSTFVFVVGLLLVCCSIHLRHKAECGLPGGRARASLYSTFRDYYIIKTVWVPHYWARAQNQTSSHLSAPSHFRVPFQHRYRSSAFLETSRWDNPAVPLTLLRTNYSTTRNELLLREACIPFHLIQASPAPPPL